jgi:hypothetical protein
MKHKSRVRHIAIGIESAAWVPLVEEQDDRRAEKRKESDKTS